MQGFTRKIGMLVVAGVLAPPPGRSHLTIDVLASFTSLATTDRRAALTDWLDLLRARTGAHELAGFLGDLRSG